MEAPAGATGRQTADVCCYRKEKEKKKNMNKWPQLKRFGDFVYSHQTAINVLDVYIRLDKRGQLPSTFSSICSFHSGRYFMCIFFKEEEEEEERALPNQDVITRWI